MVTQHDFDIFEAWWRRRESETEKHRERNTETTSKIGIKNVDGVHRHIIDSSLAKLSRFMCQTQSMSMHTVYCIMCFNIDIFLLSLARSTQTRICHWPISSGLQTVGEFYSFDFFDFVWIFGTFFIWLEPFFLHFFNCFLIFSSFFHFFNFFPLFWTFCVFSENFVILWNLLNQTIFTWASFIYQSKWNNASTSFKSEKQILAILPKNKFTAHKSIFLVQEFSCARNVGVFPWKGIFSRKNPIAQ